MEKDELDEINARIATIEQSADLVELRHLKHLRRAVTAGQASGLSRAISKKARNTRILQEWYASDYRHGQIREMATKYSLSPRQIARILDSVDG